MCVERGWAIYSSALSDDGADIARALELLERGCDLGDVMGCSHLAEVYLEGTSVPVDEEQALRWVERGCALGHQESCANVGSLLLMTGGLSEFERALKLLTESCEAKVGNACENLGTVYEAGFGVAPDPERARSLYRLACSLESSTGCFKLARGRLGAAPDDPEEISAIIALLERSCELGEAEGCNAVGLIYRDGMEGRPPDVDAAFRWLARGCDLGPGEACVHLAAAHSLGAGTPQDMARAVDLLETNCEAGIGWGCIMLAALLVDVEVDHARAQALVERGCELDEQACEVASELGLR